MSSELTLGWREWVHLPELGIDWIKAKVDTGARTSALHAFYTERFTRDGRDWVRFGVHPRQKNDDLVIHCEAPVIDERVVRDSGGHQERRTVIETVISLNGEERRVEMTLTDRDSMLFRMLIGRTAMNRDTVVSPGQSFLLGGSRKAPPESPGS